VCPPGICPKEPEGEPQPPIPGPEPDSRSTTTWSGDCKGTGTIFFERPYTLLLENNNNEIFFSGTCKGTLNGEPYDGPAQGYIDQRNMNKPMSCELGASNNDPGWMYFGSGSPNDVDATLLDIYVDVEGHGPGVLPFRFSGAYNGHAGGFLTLHVDQKALEDCAGEGLKSADFDLESHTISTLYG
jgi:hypothetical protein